MNKTRLSIEYHVTMYDEQGRIQPESAKVHFDAMEAIFGHIGAIGALLQLVDESKLDRVDSNSHSLMLSNLGELCNSLGKAGIAQLLHLAEMKESEKDNDAFTVPLSLIFPPK